MRIQVRKIKGMNIKGQFYSASLWFLLASLAFISINSINAFGQKEERRERTIDEIRVEAIHRAEVGQYPLIGLDPGDVKEAFESIHTADKDEWAAAFMHVADGYFNQAKSLENTDPTKANADYIRAWRLYSFGRWPIPASPGKQHSYEKALEAFLAHARFMDPPLEVVHIPFEGKQIIGYLRLPKDTRKGPVPLVIAVNGLEQPQRRISLKASAAILSPTALAISRSTARGPDRIRSRWKRDRRDRMLSRVLDYAPVAAGGRQEPHRNARRRAGVAYWATKMANRRSARRLRGLQRTVSAGG